MDELYLTESELVTLANTWVDRYPTFMDAVFELLRDKRDDQLR